MKSFFLILVLVLCSTAFAGEKIFTDADLERYSPPESAGSQGGFSTDGRLPLQNAAAARSYREPYPIPYSTSREQKTERKPVMIPANSQANVVFGSGRRGCKIVGAADRNRYFSSSCGKSSYRICKIFSIRNEAGGRRFSGVIHFKLSNGASEAVPFQYDTIDSGQTVPGEVCLGTDASGKFPSIVFAECEF